MAEPAENANLDAAQRYAAHGWDVFPCVSGEKLPATKHGFEDATRDPGQIAHWWNQNPGRNVAIRTGAPHGPDVVDVDNHGERGNGFSAWNEAKHGGLVQEPQAIIRTPSGGMHAYFRGTDQRSAKIPARHLDFRSTGGYVLAPPSHVGGRPYVVVEHQPSAAAVDFAAVRKLVEPGRQPARLPQPPGGRPRDVGHLAGWVAGLPEGNRNDGLFWAANRAAEARDTAALDAIAKAARSAGLDEREVDRTIRSALRQGERPFEHQRQAEAS